MGLLKTGSKAAGVVTTADVIHERVLARQDQHTAGHGHPGHAAAVAQPVPAPPMPAAPAPAALPSPDMGKKLAQLKEAGELRARGVVTDAEFEVQKARI